MMRKLIAIALLALLHPVAGRRMRDHHRRQRRDAVQQEDHYRAEHLQDVCQ